MVRGSHAHLLTDSLPAEAPSADITGNKGFETGSSASSKLGGLQDRFRFEGVSSAFQRL